MTDHMVHMAAMGLLVAVMAPALLVVSSRAFPQLDRATVPAALALPGFVTLHAAVTVYTSRGPAPPLRRRGARGGERACRSVR